MDQRHTQRIQRRILQQTQQRLNRLLRRLMRSHLSKRANSDTSDVLEDLLSRSVANSMFTNGFSVGAFGLTSPSTSLPLTVPGPGLMSATTSESSPTEAPESEMADICNDIRGRDRACCNSASRCFDDVKGVVDELENAPPGSFTLMSACRKVGSELKRDKICVQRSLSRCGGPDRVLLQRRFTNRVDTLYDQFYKHCDKDSIRATLTPTDPAVTTETPTATDVAITLRPGTTDSIPTTTHGGMHIPLSQIPGWNNNNNNKPTDFSPVTTEHDHSTHDHNRNILHETGPTSGSGAVLAGAITGGIVLLLVLIVGLVFWCKSRREKNGSNGSMDSAGIFFQKRPKERSHGQNNNKQPLHRQESAIYAEIDEAMVNPGYKPPVPGNMPGSYLSPISDEDSYTPPPSIHSGTGGPMATTRGQLSYGPILAANGATESQNKNLFYSSASVTDPRIHDHETFLTQKNLQTGTGNDSNESAYITAGSFDESLDDYEEPISTNSSLRYTQIEQLPVPGHQAPEVPNATSEKKSASPPKHGVSVFPSNPFVPFKDTKKPDGKSTEPAQPVAKPRRAKKELANNNTALSDTATSGKMADNEIIKRADVMAGSRDSTMSDASAKSSHHYFVLEPDHTQMDYENAVSSPKLV